MRFSVDIVFMFFLIEPNKDTSPSPPKEDPTESAATPNNSAAQSAPSIPDDQKTLSIVLRMRNPKKELNDIRFEYQPSKDTTEGIAAELLTNGLIANNDVQIMSSSMQQLIENPPPNRVITFRVSTGFSPEDNPDEKNLLGFAQLSLAN